MIRWTIFLFGLCCSGFCAEAEKPEIIAARKLFGSYEKRYQAYDSGVAELYAEDAKIRNTRKLPGGQVKESVIPAGIYKDAIRKMMPLAKARGDTSTYSSVRYSLKEGKVRITALRLSKLKNHYSLLQLLVGPVKGEWKVLEERTESKP